MKLELVAVSGRWKGRSWPIERAPLILGRGDDVHIQIPHRTVSRHHCQLAVDGERVLFRDLGSRNPALVNGLPERECIVNAGDEIALGPALFLVTTGSRPGSGDGHSGANIDTGSWPDDVIAVAAGGAGKKDANRPRTIDDLALLHEVSREFSCCTGTEELLASLDVRLRQRFAPSALWMARVRGEDDLEVQGAGEPGSAKTAGPPLKEMRRALRERRGLAVSTKKTDPDRRLDAVALVAPVHFAGVDLGVLAIQTEAPRGMYQEDLTLLMLFAQTLAPFLYALEDLDQLRRDNERLRARAGESLVLIGESNAMRRIREQIKQAAQSDLPVMITGETGTGKELVARILLARSSRRNKPFIVVNCAAIPRDLFEGELFGHAKGAFTGATESTTGLLAQAHDGTLLLDEVGDLSLDNQARILRVIEYGTFRRIGATAETRIDVRVIAATNKDLQAAIKEGAFRQDLYHRLNGFEIHVPPLRERPADIPVLARHFFEMGKNAAHRPLEGIAPEAVEYLTSYPWPGNVRQLRSRIQRAISIAKTPAIQLDDVLSPVLEYPEQNAGQPPLTLRDMERRHIGAILERCRGDIQQAAKVLQIGRSTLYRKIDEYGLKP